MIEFEVMGTHDATKKDLVMWTDPQTGKIEFRLIGFQISLPISILETFEQTRLVVFVRTNALMFMRNSLSNSEEFHTLLSGTLEKYANSIPS